MDASPRIFHKPWAWDYLYEPNAPKDAKVLDSLKELSILKGNLAFGPSKDQVALTVPFGQLAVSCLLTNTGWVLAKVFLQKGMRNCKLGYNCSYKNSLAQVWTPKTSSVREEGKKGGEDGGGREDLAFVTRLRHFLLIS